MLRMSEEPDRRRQCSACRGTKAQQVPTQTDKQLSPSSPARCSMNRIKRFFRSTYLRLQLHSLDQQARHIVDARNHALARLFEIQRERESKELALRRMA